MKRIWFLWGISLLLYHLADAQLCDKTDSLRAEFDATQDLYSQVDLLNQLASAYSKMDDLRQKDSTLVFAKQAITLSESIQYKEGLAEAYYQAGKHKIGIEDNPAEATQYFLESLGIFSKVKDSSGASKCYMQLGLISYLLQYYEAAVEQLLQSLQMSDEPTAKYLVALSYTEMDSFSLAKKYFSKAIEDYSILKAKNRLNECYLWKGRLYLKVGKLDSAYFFINRTIEGKIGQKDSLRLIRSYAFLSEVYLEWNELDNAIYYAERSYEMEMSKTTEQDDEIAIIQASRVLAKAYEVKEDYKRAYFFIDVYNKYSDHFQQGSTKQKVADMQSLFEFKQKMQLEKLRQQNEKDLAEQRIAKEKILRNAFLIGSALLLLLLIVLYNRFQLKQKANESLKNLYEIITHEKKRSDDLLLNILPEEVAEELKDKGKAEARNFDLVSILFTDFKAFTQLSENLSARDLVEEINACFEAFDGIMDKNKIEKIKTIGDAYMAAGGIPKPTEASIKNTVLAAIEMQAFISKRKVDMDRRNLPAFEMRVGIHTGPVVAGIVGVKKFQYDIWGDTVNTASRMESSGEIGKVNISRATYEWIKDEPDFAFENRGKLRVKGKGELEMWFVYLKGKQ